MTNALSSITRSGGWLAAIGIMALALTGGQLFTAENIKNIGFPIAVAVFVLVRLNGKMDRLTESILGLTGSLDTFVKVSSAQDDARTEKAVSRVIEAVHAAHEEKHAA